MPLSRMFARSSRQSSSPQGYRRWSPERAAFSIRPRWAAARSSPRVTCSTVRDALTASSHRRLLQTTLRPRRLVSDSAAVRTTLQARAEIVGAANVVATRSTTAPRHIRHLPRRSRTGRPSLGSGRSSTGRGSLAEAGSLFRFHRCPSRLSSHHDKCARRNFDEA